VEAVDELEADAKKHDQNQKDGGAVQLAVFHPDRLDDIRDVLAPVDRDLDQ
jgi:hypothetical protein